MSVAQHEPGCLVPMLPLPWSRPVTTIALPCPTLALLSPSKPSLVTQSPPGLQVWAG